MSLLDRLNERQREAVAHHGGPLLILAGAGSGKTRVLTHRIAYLIKEMGVRPHRIIAVTFTNKAAEEMKGRVRELIGRRELGLWIGTFHAMCARMLRRDGTPLGFSSNFSIYDEGEQVSLIKRTMTALNISTTRYAPRAVLAYISRAKSDLVTPEEYLKFAAGPFERIVVKVYQAYQEGLRERNAMDFDDIIVHAVHLLRDHPAIGAQYAERFQHVLIDEYQDTNHAQYQLASLLSAKHRNICVVGDDDQSIYMWRGADIRNILEFERDFPEATVIRLEENYRSTKIILRAASSVVANNRGRKGKELWTRNDEGSEIILMEADDEEEEGYRVADEIERLTRGASLKLGELVVLYRTNAQSRALEDALRRAGLPYVIVGGVRFYERKEVKDVLAYLKVISNPRDTESLRRILNVPRRGIGEKTVQDLEAFARAEGITLLETIGRAGDLRTISSGRRDALVDLAGLIGRLSEVRHELDVGEIVARVLEESVYLKALKEEGTVEADARRENVEELLAAAVEFALTSDEPGLDSFLAQTSLVAEIDDWEEPADAVTLMTAHNAKGLEFPTVFVTGLEEGLFPHSSALYDPEEMEEERRLFYVAVTRACRSLYLAYAYRRRRGSNISYGEPSRFIDEIPPELIVWPEGHDPVGRETEDIDVHVGSVVRHPQWGLGKILAIEGSGDRAKATMVLVDGREKKVLLKYARLEPA
jgi:DNA helicase-2/ATP-dependent DNA helicase PcrA